MRCGEKKSSEMGARLSDSLPFSCSGPIGVGDLRKPTSRISVLGEREALDTAFNALMLGLEARTRVNPERDTHEMALFHEANGSGGRILSEMPEGHEEWVSIDARLLQHKPALGYDLVSL